MGLRFAQLVLMQRDVGRQAQIEATHLGDRAQLLPALAAALVGARTSASVIGPASAVVWASSTLVLAAPISIAVTHGGGHYRWRIESAMKTRALPLLLGVLTTSALGACGQTIVVVECDGHAGEDAKAGDAGFAADGGDAAADAAEGPDVQDGGVLPTDTGVQDSGTLPDAGPGCGRYCIRSVMASSIRVDTREIVTLTPVVENPGQVALSYRVKPAEIPLTRPPSRPAAVLSELMVEYSVDATTGIGSFRLADVPPWFMSTTFELRIYAKGPGAGDPEVFGSALVTVRGNFVFSAQVSTDGAVIAVASDGRPARAVPPKTHGELVTMLVRDPRAVLLTKAGTLLVYDYGLTEPTLLQFELTGEDQQLSTFAARDAQGQQLFDDGNMAYNSIAELADGRFAVVDVYTGRPQYSRLVLFNPDGSFDRVILAPSQGIYWGGVGVRENGELLLARREGSMSRVERFDPTTGAQLTPDFVSNLPATVRAVQGVPGGGAYVSGDGYVLLVGPTGSRSSITPLPGGGSTYWRALAPFEPGRIIAVSDEFSGTAGMDLIEGRTWVRNIRQPNANNVQTGIQGAAFLE